MQLYNGGQGVIGPNDQTTPCTPHIALLLFIEQSKTRSATPSRPAEGATDDDQPTIDAAEEGVYVGLDRELDAFLGSSRVT